MTPDVHVAFLVGSLRMGGAERMMVHTANELSKSMRITFITLTGGGVLEQELNSNIKRVSFGKKKSLQAFFPLCHYLKKERPHALISTQIHVNLIAVLLKLYCNISARVILREATTPGSQFNVFRDLRSRLVSYTVAWLYPKADAVVAICEAVRKNLLQHKFISPEKVSVIYNPVVNAALEKGRNEIVAHRFFGQGVPVFISVGRLTVAKNFTLLLKAFSKVVAVRDARLIIIGSGPLLETLTAEAKDNGIGEKVDFAGQIVNPYPYLVRADVYVLSSLFEGLPNALIEAMACGTQLVSVDCPGGSREILEDGSLGRLIKMNDVQALADAMVDALKNPVDRQKLQASAARFGSAQTAEGYVHLINKLIHEG